MSNALSAWNLQLDEAAKECQALTMQMLMGLQQELAAKRNCICMLLDALTLLDFLSGAVAFMKSRQQAAAFCRPQVSLRAGAHLLHHLRNLQHRLLIAVRKLAVHDCHSARCLCRWRGCIWL